MFMRNGFWGAIALVLSLVAGMAYAETGPVPAASDYADSVTVDGDTILITEAAAADIKGDSLQKIVMQAASTPVFDNDGAQVGYVLTDIDRGSVFETLGLRNGDVILALVLDGREYHFETPKIAVEAMRAAKEMNSFDALIIRKGKQRTLRVRVGR